MVGPGMERERERESERESELEIVLRRVGLPPRVSARIASMGLTVEDILATPSRELASKLRIDRKVADRLIRTAAEVASTPKPASHVPRRRILSLGVRSVDGLLGGGLSEGSFVELYGEPGSGKTQFALHLCVRAMLPQERGGLGGGSVYIDTEGGFSAARLREMAEGQGVPPDLALSSVRVVRARSVPSLMASLDAADGLVREGEAVLVVIDSLLAPFRLDYRGMGELAERQHALAEALAIVRRTTARGGIVLATNQVVGGREKRPAGGYVLGHAPDVVLSIRRSLGLRRILGVVDSSFLPEGEVLLAITRRGLEDVDEKL